MNRTLVIATILSLATPALARGQNPPRPPTTTVKAPAVRPKECNVVTEGVYAGGSLTSHAESFGTGAGQHNTFYGGGVDARCAGTDQRLISDSAEHYGAQKMLIFINRVHYTEARVKLDADRITYYTAEERLVAEGNVHGVTNTGTTFTGPHATYYRAARGVRDRSKLDADGRPDLWLSPRDAGNGTKDSVNLKADHVISDNDELFYAKGQVIIERPDLHSTSDSAFMDNVKEIVRLRQDPKIAGRGERKFTLEGELIDIFSKDRQVERVKSAGKGRATSDDVVLTADTIDLRVSNQKLERAYAWGPKRAHAHSKDNDITADSIDVLMPGQVVHEMRALRDAIAETPPDSAKIISKQMDWLRGDVIIAQFDSVPPGDTTNKPAIKQIIATGAGKAQARAYYQIPPNGVPRTDRPNISYSLGNTITVKFVAGKVDNVHMDDQAKGWYVEAIQDSTAKDSTNTKKGAPAKATPGKKKP
jgi:lipopolysaccharide export system protein LptA